MNILKNQLQTFDTFKKPQIVPFLKSTEKEKGSILGGFCTILTYAFFGLYVGAQFASFFTDSNDNYTVLENLQDPKYLVDRTLNETYQGYGLYFKSIKSKDYDKIIKDPEQLAKYVSFY